MLLVHGSTVETQVNQSVHFLIEVLRQLGSLWPIAARYGTILQRIMNDYQESQSSGGGGGGIGSGRATISTSRNTLSSSTIPVLAGMRRDAYNLDQLISSHHASPGRPLRTVSLPTQPATSPSTLHPLHHQTTSTTARAQWWSHQHTATTSPISAGPFASTGELEYLEAFDFFNYPRLPGGSVAAGLDAQMSGTAAGADAGAASMQLDLNLNIDRFLVDPGADWLEEGNFG